MVHCYATENDGIGITDCADKKAYFILINGNPEEIWCGMDLNEMNGFSSPVYDDDVIQVYETIDECESDDYDEIVAWTNELISELHGVDYVEDWLDENCILLGSITVPDPIGFDTNPVATATWTINNKEVQSLTINNKEVQSITRVSDNAIIYQKQQLSIPYHIYDDEIEYIINNHQNPYIIEDGNTFEIYGALEEPTTITLHSWYVWTDEDMFLFRVNNEMGIYEWGGEELTNPFPTYIVFDNGVWYLYDNNTLTNPFQSVNDNGLTFEDGNIIISLMCEDETNLTFMEHD